MSSIVLARRPAIAGAYGSLAVLVCIAVLVGWAATLWMGLGTLAYLLMCWGITVRRERALHVRAMLIAMALDVLLVVALELSRHAVGVALSQTLNIYQLTHVVCSTLAVAAYGPVLWLGQQRLRHGRHAGWHGAAALTAFALRSAGFIFMFSLLWRQ